MPLLAVDAGRSEVEARSERGVITFPSDVSKAKRMNNPANIKGDLEIEIEGHKWWVGRLAKEEGGRFKRNNYGKSKADKMLKIQVIASAIHCGITNGFIDLGLLVPVDKYTKEERTNIRSIVRGTHTFTYWFVEKDKEKPEEKKGEITINDRIIISQEGAAAYWSHPQDEQTCTLDFGAKTINYVFHKANRVYNNSLSGTINHGWEIMKDDHGYRGIDDSEIDLKVKQEMAEELAQKLIDEAGLKEWDTNCITQVFGGVTDLVFPYIKAYFPRAVKYPDPRNGNVNGLYKLLEGIFVYAT